MLNIIIEQSIDKKSSLLISNNVNTIHETTITKWLPKSVYAINDLENVNYVSMRMRNSIKICKCNVNVRIWTTTYSYS